VPVSQVKASPDKAPALGRTLDLRFSISTPPLL
jgi:hypothetical protein